MSDPEARRELLEIAAAYEQLHPEARRRLLEIAAGYQRLAQSTEERTRRRKQNSS
jgi:Protein of unknown function (DUF3106)